MKHCKTFKVTVARCKWEGLARLNQYEVEIAEEYPFKREGVKKVHFNIEYGGGW